MTSPGRYEIVGPLARGAASRFIALQRGIAGFRRLVVLRRLRAQTVRDEEVNQVFLSELRSVVAFSHPGIADVYELDAIDGDLYLVTELIPGANLAELYEPGKVSRNPPPPGMVLRAVRDAALALHYAHTFVDPVGRPRSVVHRNLSDRTLVLGFDGVTRIVDFGLPPDAVRAEENYFAPPEALERGVLDARSDVFSLAAVLHACLTGVRPSYARVSGRPPNRVEFPAPSERLPEVGTALDPVIFKALQPIKERRHATALELAQELDRAAGSRLMPVEQCGDLVERRFRSRREEQRALVSEAEGRVVTAVLPLSALVPPGQEIRSIPTGGDAPITQVIRGGGEVGPTLQPAFQEMPTHQVTRPDLMQGLRLAPRTDFRNAPADLVPLDGDLDDSGIEPEPRTRSLGPSSKTRFSGDEDPLPVAKLPRSQRSGSSLVPMVLGGAVFLAISVAAAGYLLEPPWAKPYVVRVDAWLGRARAEPSADEPAAVQPPTPIAARADADAVSAAVEADAGAAGVAEAPLAVDASVLSAPAHPPTDAGVRAAVAKVSASKEPPARSRTLVRKQAAKKKRDRRR